MKIKTLVLVGAALLSAGAMARPHGWAPGPMPMHVHHHGGHWGRGGRHFWPGFVGGVVGGAIVGASFSRPVVVAQPAVVVAQPTVVAAQPVVVQQQVVAAPVAQVQNVWVEGRYVDQLQPNGTVLRVWSPGHYEQRTVVVQ